jgi:hypothetical protein
VYSLSLSFTLLGTLRFRITKVCNKKKKPVSSYFDLLPARALGLLASYLDEDELVEGLLSAYPAIGAKVRRCVAWKTIGRECFGNNVLGFLRCLMLTCVETTGNFIVNWKPQDEETYREWKLLLTSPYLRKVVVYDPPVLLGEKISNDVLTLEMVLPHDLTDKVIWPMFEKDLLVPAVLQNLEITAVVYEEEEFPASLASSSAGAAFYALFSRVPNLDFRYVNPQPEFWGGFETFGNIVELCLFYNDFTDFQAAPLGQFANLRKLQLEVTAMFFEQLLYFDVVMPQLETLELTVLRDCAFERDSADVWDHLASLVPNLLNLIINAHVEASQNFDPDVLAVAIPESFGCLRKLKVRGVVPLKLNSVQDVVDRFEAVRPGGVKEVIVDGTVHYARRECLNVCSAFTRWVKRKKCQNRQFTFDVKWDFPSVAVERRLAGHMSRRQVVGASCYTFKFSQP